MIPNVGTSELAWHWLMAKIATADAQELAKLERSTVRVHGSEGGAVTIIRDAIERRRAELEGRST